MAIIINPAGTISVTYSRSGTTIQKITANGVTLGSATPISSYSGLTIVIVATIDGDPQDKAVVLPASSEIGDVVEIYNNGVGIIVFAPSDQNINGNASVSRGSGDPGLIFRKVSSSTWRFTQ